MDKSTDPSQTIKLLERIAGGSVPRGNVLCIGDLILDVFVYGVVERLSPEAPIPILQRTDARYALGGVGNVAANIASLGGHCHLIAPIGRDDAAQKIRTILSNKKAITSSPVVCDDRRTSEKRRYISDRRQMLRVDSETTAIIDDSTMDEILENAKYALPQVSALVLSDYRKGGLPPALLKKLIDLAKKRGVEVFVDPKGSDYSIYSGVDYITPNLLELSQAVGRAVMTDDEVIEAARELMKRYSIGNVLATRSELGMSLIEAKEVHHIATDAIDVFDVAGAGDTVLGCFSLCRSVGVSAFDAAHLANVAAGVVVEKSEVATVSPQEISDRVSERDFRYRRLHRRAQSKIIGGKTMNEDGAMDLLREWRDKGAIIGFTNGCFDIVHTGHLHLLHQAAEQSDKLIVAINSDASVRRLKGSGRPLQSEERRADFLAHLDMVDLVVVFDEDTPLRLIELFVPDLLIKGNDYSEGDVIGGDFVKSRGGRVFLADFKDGHSSTAIIERMKDS